MICFTFDDVILLIDVVENICSKVDFNCLAVRSFNCVQCCRIDDEEDDGDNVVEYGGINAAEKKLRKRSTEIGQQTKQRPRLRTAIEKASRFVFGC